MTTTPNLALTQYATTDTINWVNEYNKDMLNIDTAVKEIATSLDETNVQVATKANQTSLDATNANVADLSTNKADKSEVTNVMTPKGNLSYASLPTIGNTVGWYYYCPDGDGTNGAGNYVWNGTSWYFGGTGDQGYNMLKNDIVQYHGKNLIGTEFGKFYPVYIKAGSTLSMSTCDGTVIPNNLTYAPTLYMYDINKNLIDYFTFNTGTNKRDGMKPNETRGDIRYLRWLNTGLKIDYYRIPIQVEIGNVSTSYQKYIEPPLFIRKEIDNVNSLINDEYIEYDKDRYTNGSWLSTEPYFTRADNRIRPYTELKMKKGDVLKIVNGNHQHAVGIWDGAIKSSTMYRNDTSWNASDEIINFNREMLVIITFRNADNNNINPSDFNGGLYVKHENLELAKVTDIGKDSNLIGEKENVLYPVSIAAGTMVTFSTSDGSNPVGSNAIKLYDINKILVDTWDYSTARGSSRTVTFGSYETRYISYSVKQNVPLQVEIGEGATEYKKYIVPYSVLQEKWFENANNDEMLKKILQSKSHKSLHVGQSPVLGLIHFSDIHADTVRLKRLVEFGNRYSVYINDIICTGDMVSDRYSNGMDFWNNIIGTEKILTSIGNHDALSSTDTTYNFKQDIITQQSGYERYIAPYISNWGGADCGVNLTYYYKDYTNYNIRLIVVNPTLLGTDEINAQNLWLIETLNSAKTNGYSVVIGTHCPPESNGINYFNCTFNTLAVTFEGENDGNLTPLIYQASVQNFINSGGKFICWLAGHTHYDFVYTTQDYPNQIWIVVTCAKQSTNNDQDRTEGTSNQDAFNIVFFDTNTKCIKLVRVGADRDIYMRHLGNLCINYVSKQIMYND